MNLAKMAEIYIEAVQDKAEFEAEINELKKDIEWRKVQLANTSPMDVFEYQGWIDQIKAAEEKIEARKGIVLSAENTINKTRAALKRLMAPNSSFRFQGYLFKYEARALIVEKEEERVLASAD